jgi:hypothetical protein
MTLHPSSNRPVAISAALLLIFARKTLICCLKMRAAEGDTDVALDLIDGVLDDRKRAC